MLDELHVRGFKFMYEVGDAGLGPLAARFALPLAHFVPESLTYSVPVF